MLKKTDSLSQKLLTALELFPQGVGIFPTPVAIRQGLSRPQYVEISQVQCPCRAKNTLFFSSPCPLVLTGFLSPLHLCSPHLRCRGCSVCVPSGAKHPGHLLSSTFWPIVDLCNNPHCWPKRNYFVEGGLPFSIAMINHHDQGNL